MLTSQLGKTRHPGDLTPNRTAAIWADVSITVFPQRWRNAYIQYSASRHIHFRHTELCPYAESRHMQSHSFDKLRGCRRQQMLNLLRSLTRSQTHTFTAKLPHTLIKHITCLFHFFTPTFPTASLCSRCFNDMLWDRPVPSARVRRRPNSIEPWDCLCKLPALHSWCPQCEAACRNVYSVVLWNKAPRRCGWEKRKECVRVWEQNLGEI